ncbi:MAG: helix-turn-helix domain-containing protein [Faecalibacillus sp.]
MIGNKIRTKRLQKNLTISELAKKVDVSNSYISQLEHDNTDPSVSMLQKIANALDAPIAYFFETEYEDPIIIRHKEIQYIQQNHYQYKYISPQNTAMTVKYYELFNNSFYKDSTLQACLHILKGTVEVCIHQSSYILHDDDSILLTNDFTIKNNDEQSAIFIICEVHV